MDRDKDFILFSTPIGKYTYKGLLLLAVLYFGSLAFAAILSPLFFQLVHFFDPETSSYLANKPFPDYFDRARLLSVVLLLPFLFLKCGLMTRKAIGFRQPSFKTFLKWFAYGVGMMTIVFGLYFILNTITPKDNWSVGRILEKAATAAIAAIIIALIEESFFRGLVFKAFYSAFNPWIAIILSSMFFSMLHFKMNDAPLANLPHEQIGITEGFYAAWQTITAFADGFNALQFANLTLVGILLHQAFMLTKNLWAAIGLHAGWVFIILPMSKLYTDTENANHFTGTERVIDGTWVGLVMLSFVILFAYKQKRSSHTKYPGLSIN